MNIEIDWTYYEEDHDLVEVCIEIEPWDERNIQDWMWAPYEIEKHFDNSVVTELEFEQNFHNYTPSASVSFALYVPHGFSMDEIRNIVDDFTDPL